MEKTRCKWVDPKSEIYVKYHDEEWGVPSYNDEYLFELLILESFQAGLSWITILNKRENFRKAFDNFDYKKIANYNEDKIEKLLQNQGIIRNRRKVIATIENARIFMKIQQEYGSFSKYIWGFNNNEIIKNIDNNLKTTSQLSDNISKDLQKRGMKFVGSTIIYSYLQAIGIINDHEIECFKY